MFDNVLLLIWGRATGPCTAEFIRIYNSSKVHWITNLNLRWSSTRLGIAWSLCSPRQTRWTHYGFHLIVNLVLDCWRVHGLIGSVMTYPARVPWWTMSISWQLATFATSYVAAEKFSAVNLERTRCASRHKQAHNCTASRVVDEGPIDQ